MKKNAESKKVTLEAIDSRFNSFVGKVIDKIELTESVLRKEMNGRFDEVNVRFEEVNARIDGVEQRLDQKINGVEQKINGVEQRLGNRIDKVEQRLDHLDQKIDKVDFSLRLVISTVESNLAKKIDDAAAQIGETLQRHEREITQLKDAAHH